jgi:hypothetical protein
VELQVSTFGSDSCVMGGLALILLQILRDPTAWFPKAPSSAQAEHSLFAPAAL